MILTLEVQKNCCGKRLNVLLRNYWVLVLLQIPLLYLTDKCLTGLSREPFAVSFISPKVFALCQEDDGECDRAVSTETRSECCVLFTFLFFFFFFTSTIKRLVTNVRDPRTQNLDFNTLASTYSFNTFIFETNLETRNNFARSVCTAFWLN